MKFGIAILGIYGEADNDELFQALGRQDEFTLFCAVALTNSSDDPEGALWTLARNVEGWGRIHVVERLAETENPEIKDWLLREGYRNSIMYEYLAYTCATAGDLLSALSVEQVDREQLISAGEIVEALIAGGPAEDIDSYEDGALAVQAFLGHMRSRAESLADLVHVDTIKRLLDAEEADWETRSERGWTGERRQALRATCETIMGRPEWPGLVQSGLESQDELEFHRATRGAEALGIDTWDVHWRWLQDKPTDSGRWYQVMAGCNQERIGQVIEAAESWIDLDRIATGAGSALGLGPEWEPHSCLDSVLQDLRRFPGHGARLREGCQVDYQSRTR